VRAERVTDPVAHHAEGPVWSDGWGGLRWVDLLVGALFHADVGVAGQPVPGFAA
jgi:sugar lactone lactonase YvrE